jgi:hypothetical protein
VRGRPGEYEQDGSSPSVATNCGQNAGQNG